jgi:hypothetical protein
MSVHCFVGVELSLSLLRKQGLPNRTFSFGCRRSNTAEDGRRHDCHLEHSNSKDCDQSPGMRLANINQEVINEILLPLLNSKQQISKISVQKQLMLIRLVSKQFKAFADTYCCILFPESFMHLILAKHNPASLEIFFKENELARNAFKKVTEIDNYARFHDRQILVPNVSEKRTIRIGQDYFDLLDPHDELDTGSACSAQYWARDSAINELRRSVEEIQRPLRQYFVQAGVVTAEDIEFHVFTVNASSCDCACGGVVDDINRFFLALKSRTLESSYEEYGIIKSSKARPGRDVHLQPLDMSPISPHALWIFSRIVSTLASVGRTMEPGSVAAIAEPAGDKQMSWKFLSRASFSYV